MPIAPLVVLRILFGGLMLGATIRFWTKGWIRELYIMPEYYFSYWGFGWVRPLGEWGMYGLFALMALSALCILLGYRYRLFSLLFFLSFTYVELIDKSNYLNHYYFVSLVSLLMVLIPAHRSFSLDVLRKPSLRLTHVPRWTFNIFRLQIGIVYVFAGIAKINPDWLLHAQPLATWLPAYAHVPLIGPLFDFSATAYFFSWAGCLYDLTIPFFLLNRHTRPFALLAVIFFHGLTAWMFPIGIFPYVMIAFSLLFFPVKTHQKLIARLRKYIDWLARASARALPLLPSKGRGQQLGNHQSIINNHYLSRLPWRVSSCASIHYFLILFFTLQLLLPFRYLLYPGQLFWGEEGFRFSWRVMLVEKAGYVTFTVRDPETGRQGEVMSSEYLTPWQIKNMSTQPDMILQFAHFLEDKFRQQGMNDPQVFAEAYVTLNGRSSRLLLDPKRDLTQEKDGLAAKDWILTYNE